MKHYKYGVLLIDLQSNHRLMKGDRVCITNETKGYLTVRPVNADYPYMVIMRRDVKPVSHKKKAL
jgi:hypothetical protein